ncbi:hypothetical protein DPM19_06160 [Actinomadura craniellae]|uniref:Uncharacterized protein n=1 Tax=Actinomadura craniellae TaxID=2231787 RepID=A0A365HBJ0_9ACTN|nr:hypothetical protein DPM19_06160 [Actinomadura craniellae]
MLFTLGDVAVTNTSLILPHGRYPLRGTVWTVHNQTYATSAIPAWAIVVAIVGFLFLCVFSLFFLLAKETRMQGYIEVHIQSPDGLHHVTRIAAVDPFTFGWVQQQVSQAQALASGPTA